MMEGCCSRFTAAEGGARLAAAAATKNILAVEYASFIPVRLLYEKAYQIRGSLKAGMKRSIYITRATRVQVVAFELKILTDLGTIAALAYEDVDDWLAELESKEVIICTSSVLKKILEVQLLRMCNINVLIVDSCHLIYRDEDLKYIMKSYKQCPREDQPIILALTYPLFTPNKKDNDEKGTPETKDEPPKETEMQDEDRQGKKEMKDAQAGLFRKKETEDKSTDEKDLDEPSGALPRMTVTNYEEMGLYENVDDFDMYDKLEWKIEELEEELCCQMDLAEDIDGGKRISTSAKPRELIIEYSARPSNEQLPSMYVELEKYMRDTVQDALDFIEDHRHDPTEIYGDEMYDEFMSIPNPTIDPKNIFKQFLYVLEQLGPFAADKAAICLLSKLEKLKIKIPYERHFILMCLCTTVFLKIRCYAELLFDQIEDEWVRIKTFSSPKVLRFAEILEKFRPPDIRNQNFLRQDGSILTDTKDNETGSGCDRINKENINKMLNDVEECDFKSLSNKIQDKVNTYESNLKDLDSPTDENSTSSSNNPNSQTSENSNDSLTNPSNTTVSEIENIGKAEYSVTKTDTRPDTRVSGMDTRGNEIMVQQRGILGFTRRSGYRLRGKTRILRNNAARALQQQQNPDALCGIVYMKEPLIAKVMFSVMADMSRSNSRLNYISAQYCATETPADPGTEPRECQRQGKRQEDVLKKFRMHECNLLLATSALEEGIDLPRCNLVLRWDIPVSYRSYGLCRGRARATRSAAALLCSNNSDTTEMLLQNVATYRELDQIISRKCGCGIQDEPPQSEEDHADAFTNFVKPYSPSDNVTNFYSIHTSQKIHFEDTMRSKDGIATNVVNSGVVVDNFGNLQGKVKGKSKDDLKDAKNNAEETAKKGNDIEKDLDRIENVDKENGNRSENICLDKDSSKNDICEGNNNVQETDTSRGNNNLEGVDNSKIINTKDNDNDTPLTNTKVNEAMEIVNDTITTVNEAINTVNEAIKTDGMDDLLTQMENLTVTGNFQTENMQQSSETGDIEDNVDEDESETDEIEDNVDDDEVETDFERERAEFVKKYDIPAQLYEFLTPEERAGKIKIIKPIVSDDPSSMCLLQTRLKDTEDPQNLSTNDLQTPTNPSNISEQLTIAETENLDTQNLLSINNIKKSTDENTQQSSETGDIQDNVDEDESETDEIEDNVDDDEVETDFERERAEFVKKYDIPAQLYEFLTPEERAGKIKIIKPIVSDDPSSMCLLQMRLKDTEDPQNLSTNDLQTPTNPSNISEQLTIAETENLDTQNLLSINNIKKSTDENTQQSSETGDIEDNVDEDESETDEIEDNVDEDEVETDFERERAEFVKKYDIPAQLYEFLTPEERAGKIKIIKPIVSDDPSSMCLLQMRLKDTEDPQNLSTNDLQTPANPSNISEQLTIAETENLDTQNLLSINNIKNSTDPSNITTELAETQNLSINDNSNSISDSVKLETQNISNEDILNFSNVSKQLAIADTEKLNTQSLSTKDSKIPPNNCNILKQLITTDADKSNTQNISTNNIQNSITSETSKTQIFKEERQTGNHDTQISKEDRQASAHCNKCFNVTLSGACLCSNVNLYFQLMAKSNLNKNESRRNLGDCDSAASVDLSSAIALINRYCGKLPSDTFTRLAPQWWMEEVELPVAGAEETRTAYICTLRLPLNCPVKYNIVGHPMPTKVLARRMVALQACRILHKSGELDNQLMPIGKENFKAVELEAVNTMCAYIGGENDVHDSARPGSTKRRQYYYKRTAWAFTDCQPVIDTTDAEIYPGQDPETIDIESDIEAPRKEGVKKEKCREGKVKEGTAKKRNMLYAIVSKLWCALPERYNTRGRRLHAPQLASQAIGILMSRHEPDNLQIPSFPVYTRSGEVRVSVEHVPDADVRMSPRRAKLVRRFMRFVFAEVLRVRRRGMKLQSEGSTHNNYYIVPTIKMTQPDGSSKIDIDWSFLELIYQHTEEKKITDIEKPIIWQETTDDDQKSEKEGNKRKKGKKRMANPLLKKGDVFVFDAEKYREAVVTPWYRNQDQPQFFLVAEICWNLTPDSSFPSACHQSFRDYYSTKYGVSLTQREQPLLDVDHTSARLNLLTPRYVNRKGVALPVSSERTRRAKRDRLDQKQILIPELCRVHPFAAPLWFATVALPCVLYRINALLIADEIRRAVAIDVGLGIPKINDKFTPKFQWPPLDFGWSLAEVLSQDSEKHEKRKDEESKKELKDTESSEKVEKSEGDEDSTEDKSDEEVKEKTINEILQEKEEAAAEAAFEIGTWSNDMASSIPETSEYDDLRDPLPPNLTFCTSASGGTNWCEPISRPKSQYNAGKNFSMADSDDSFMSSDLDSDDTDLDFDGSDEDTDISGFSNSKTNTSMGVRIEYKTAHEAEAFDIERIKKVNPAPMPDELDDAQDREAHDKLIRQGSAPQEYIDKFRASVSQHKQDILDKRHLITKEEHITEVLPETKETYHSTTICRKTEQEAINELFPFGTQELTVKNGQIDVESIEKNKRVLLAKIKKKLPVEEIKKMNCFSMKDINIDDKDYVNEKVVNVGFDTKDGYEKICKGDGEFEPYYADFSPLPSYLSGKEFDFDYQPTLEGHPGPSPSVILQALTMSNANDGINLERLETIGDSFLKFAITAYLYCAHPTVHEGKLSHMRSKQVSNLNLYRLGRNKRLGARMIASKFEPHDNWLPPCHKPPPTLHPRINGEGKDIMQHLETPLDSAGCFIPYNLITQHSIPDKSIADCVEALIGAYLLECGPRGALLFMSWLGIRVLPCHHVQLDDDHPYVRRAAQHESSTSPPSPDRKRPSSSSSSCSDDEAPPQQEMFPDEDWSWQARAVGSLQPYKDSQGRWMQPIFGELKAPPSPLLRYINDPEGELNQMLSGYDALEDTLQYRFKDRSLLLQALTHASHHSNRLTDCYQRLEFLGDAILDYLITRHLYEDPRRHSPGALTDLRSALVNNTIFATLAARHGFHKYFRHMSPGLNEVLTKYVKIQEENGHSISEEHYLIQEDEMEQAEDVEVPKALGDLFESVAGAIFLDSGMSLGAVWKSYVNLMGAELEAFSAAAPKSPVRELLEAEPDTAKFGKPERLADGRRVRVCVEVFGRGTFKGVGRNYRIAKGTAARCALRHLKGAARADN